LTGGPWLILAEVIAGFVFAEVWDVDEELGSWTSKAGCLEAWFRDDVPEVHGLAAH
jgi:hypothetical protein